MNNLSKVGNDCPHEWLSLERNGLNHAQQTLRLDSGVQARHFLSPSAAIDPVMRLIGALTGPESGEDRSLARAAGSRRLHFGHARDAGSSKIAHRAKLRKRSEAQWTAVLRAFHAQS
jgi:hypothetical protein